MESGVVRPRRQASSAVGLGLALGCSQLIQFANPQAAQPSWEQLFLHWDVKRFPKTYRKPSCLGGGEELRLYGAINRGRLRVLEVVREAVGGPAAAEVWGEVGWSLAGHQPGFASPTTDAKGGHSA